MVVGERVGSPARTVDPAFTVDPADARRQRVDAGLVDLDRWLDDQVAGGLAGVERAGREHFDRVAARMVDAQAPGVAAMLRGVPAELSTDGWPGRVLERLAALHLLVRAHQHLDALPAELAASVRSRVGYPVAKAEVLAAPGVRDRWLALGSVDSVEAQLQSRRVWLHGARTRRWALWLTFAAVGSSLDATVRPGQLLDADLHFYPGSGFRALVGTEHEGVDVPGSSGPVLPLTERLADVRARFAALLATDPWASRLPALLQVSAVPPDGPGGPWRLRDELGECVPVVGLRGDPWVLLARSGGSAVPVFGEWTGAGFTPLSLLPGADGSGFTTALTS